MATRRQVLIGMGSIATGASILAYGTDTSSAEVTVGEFSVPDETFQTSTPVSGVRVDVNGSYQFKTSVVPTKVVLRLSVITNTAETQIAAKEVTADLAPEMSNSYQFTSANLLKSPDLNAVDFTPANVGDSKAQTFTIKVALEVRRNGKVLETVTAKDKTKLTVEKTKAGVDGSIGGTGETSIITKTS